MTKINKYFIERHVHFIIKLLHITLDIFLRKNFRGLIYITLAKKKPSFTFVYIISQEV